MWRNKDQVWVHLRGKEKNPSVTKSMRPTGAAQADRRCGRTTFLRGGAAPPGSLHTFEAEGGPCMKLTRPRGALSRRRRPGVAVALMGALLIGVALAMAGLGGAQASKPAPAHGSDTSLNAD